MTNSIKKMEEISFKIGGIAEDSLQPKPTEDEVKQPDIKSEDADLEKKEVIDQEVDKQKEVKEEEKEIIEQKPPTPPIVKKEEVVEKKAEPSIELDEELQEAYNFKKEYGGSLADYYETLKNWDDVGDVELMKKVIQKENKGFDLNDAELTLLLEKKLGVDLSEGVSELSEADQLHLKLEAGKQRDTLKEIQEKIKTPINQETSKQEVKSDQVVTDYVELADGSKIDKTEYETSRQDYLSNQKEAVEGLQSEVFNLEIGTGDEKKSINFEYIYEDADRHSMLSATEYLPVDIYQMYADEKGNLDHKQVNKDLWWSQQKNRDKAIGKILSAARSSGIDEVLKQETNVSFDTRQPDKKDYAPTKPIIGDIDNVVKVKLAGF